MTMSAFLSFSLVVTLAVGTSAFVNEYDRFANLECPTNQYLSYLHSIHNNHHEDRRWGFTCRAAGKTMNSCAWSGYVNNFDEALTYICPGYKVVTGIRSTHDNRREDRRFSFKCCAISGRTTKRCYTTGYANNWDGPLTLRVPHGKVLKGAFSQHSNHKEDRRWRFRICSL